LSITLLQASMHSPAADAGSLQPLADVDADGADLHTQRAVHTIALSLGHGNAAGLGAPGAGTARLAAGHVIAHHQAARVQHRPLEAGVWASVLAHLFPQQAGKQVGGCAVEQDPERLPWRVAENGQGLGQAAHRREPTHQAEPGEQAQRHPAGMLAAAAQQLVGRPGRGVQTQARQTVTLGALLEPHEQLGVHRLRAGKAAPHAPGDRRGHKQQQGAEHQQPGELDQVLREQHGVEQVEAPRIQIEQHGLAAVPVQPGQSIEHGLGQPDEDPAPAREAAADVAGLDLDCRLDAGITGERGDGDQRDDPVGGGHGLLLRAAGVGATHRKGCGTSPASGRIVAAWPLSAQIQIFSNSTGSVGCVRI
jgi:hypothetical protein